MYRLFGTFAFGVITGMAQRKCVAYSLAKREYRDLSRNDFLPVFNGVLHTGIFVVMGWQVDSLLCCLCVSALVAIGLIDQKTLEIPWEYNLFIGGLGFLRMLLYLPAWQEYLAGFFAVSSVLLAFFLFSHGKDIGGGDIKLMAAAGLFLGWEKVLQAAFLGGITGIIAYAISGKEKTKTKTIALGPYLALGIFVVMF